ncbi:plasmid pRiA4b ORF-3 family protein [Erythrobacter sp. CCH5-A1]|jgi:hypothetical protein|uniref:plasmid pRiA4b ORF-3 family protein n=1 Tax=Erythrobacter sp. CCH5-A1 TaxID=1768792 RepID=UPI00082FE0C5|nr:plasmid pRiA4b ORF-3 family protein [Erythrobacter sp. CCH5-A1]
MELVQPRISIENLKRRAKALGKKTGVQHSEALNLLAAEAGFENFNALQRASGRRLKTFPGVKRSKSAREHVLVSVELLGVPVVVSRHVLVPPGLNLEQLHGVIQIAMGWENAHLFAFTVPNIPDLEFIGRFDEGASALDKITSTKAEDMRIRQLIDGGSGSLIYRYDFGDGWLHAVTLEYVQAEWSDPEGCVLLEAKGLCPPEDCGGEPGYIGLLETFGLVERSDGWSDSRRWTRKDVAEWIGRAYRPDKELLLSDYQNRLTAFAAADFDVDMLYLYEPTWRYGGLNPNRHYWKK